MLVKFVFLSTLLTICLGVKFTFHNRYNGVLWVGIQGNNGQPHLNGGGFELKPGQELSLDSPANWGGRFWGRTGCNPNSKHCETGDCGNKLQCNGAGGAPPASLAEITLKGSGGLDYYDVSLVDGFNIQISIEPVGGSGDGGQYSCKKSACQVPLNDGCPEELKVKNGNNVIACNSACNKFNRDQDCCRGAYGTPDKCPPPVSAKYFKNRCPDAYSYAYDDHKSTFTCKSEAYLVTLG